MRILNCMWSSEAPYRSIHLVMRNFIRAVQPTEIAHLFLMGDANEQELFDCAESLNSNKRATKRIFKRYLLRRRCLKKLHEYQPELVLVDGLGMARLLLPVIKKYKNTRVLVFFHGRSELRANDCSLFSGFDGEELQIIAVSRTLAEQLTEQIFAVNIVAIPTFLMLAPVKRTGVKNKGSDRIIFGAVGRLAKGKNFTILVDLIHTLKSKKHKVRLLVAGDGQQRSLLEKKVSDLKLQDEVKFLGFEEDMPGFYDKIDILLVPSLQEGQGLVIQEALHYQTPVICSDLAVFREQLVESGAYCHPNKLEQWVSYCEKYSSAEHQVRLLKLQQKQYRKYNTLKTYRQRCRLACGLDKANC